MQDIHIFSVDETIDEKWCLDVKDAQVYDQVAGDIVVGGLGLLVNLISVVSSVFVTGKSRMLWLSLGSY